MEEVSKGYKEMFEKDLKIGQIAEIKFCEYLIQQGKKVIRTYGLNKDWDIGVYEDDRIVDTWEIKNDLLSDKTGNLAIEVGSIDPSTGKFGKKTGLFGTKANHLVIYTKKRFYELKTQEFKEFLHDNKPYLKFVKGGDRNESVMVLLRTKDLTNHSWCIINEI